MNTNKTRERSKRFKKRRNNFSKIDISDFDFQTIYEFEQRSENYQDDYDMQNYDEDFYEQEMQDSFSDEIIEGDDYGYYQEKDIRIDGRQDDLRQKYQDELRHNKSVEDDYLNEQKKFDQLQYLKEKYGLDDYISGHPMNIGNIQDDSNRLSNNSGYDDNVDYKADTEYEDVMFEDDRISNSDDSLLEDDQIDNSFNEISEDDYLDASYIEPKVSIRYKFDLGKRSMSKGKKKKKQKNEVKYNNLSSKEDLLVGDDNKIDNDLEKINKDEEKENDFAFVFDNEIEDNVDSSDDFTSSNDDGKDADDKLNKEKKFISYIDNNSLSEADKKFDASTEEEDILQGYENNELPIIELCDVSKSYQEGIDAINGVSFKINKGEFVFIVGKSGSGKSTLINLLTRQIRPTYGNVYVNGREIAKLQTKKISKYRRSIGIVFQDFKLLPDRNVFENVAFAQRVIEKTDEEININVPDILSVVGLEDRYEAFPDELSGGEKQRVAIARALVNQPSILLADEPTGNLDPKTAWEIMELLDGINRKGTTVIVVTHNVDIVNVMKKRVIAIDNGKVISDKQEGGYIHEDKNFSI